MKSKIIGLAISLFACTNTYSEPIAMEISKIKLSGIMEGYIEKGKFDGFGVFNGKLYLTKYNHSINISFSLVHPNKIMEISINESNAKWLSENGISIENFKKNVTTIITKKINNKEINF